MPESVPPPSRSLAPLLVIAVILGLAAAWAIHGGARIAPTGDPAQVDGRAIYVRCQACHGVDGKGLPGYAPSLIGNAVVLGDAPALTRHLLLGGTPAPGQWASIMPPFAAQLDDAEIAAVATWIRAQWGNRAPPVSPSVVAQQRARLQP